MTATPTKVNGTKRPAVPVLGDWQPFPIVKGVMQEEAPTPEPASLPVAAPLATVDPIAEAEAEAIRARTAAEVEAARLLAEAEADAIRVQGEAKAEQQRIANERAAMRLQKEREDHAAKLAEVRKRREQTDREAAAAREQDEAAQKTEAEQLKEIATADEKWRKYAIAFAWACGIVALPVQIAAFWNPAAWWLAAAPVMLEGGAWVVQRGAASAVANRRPLWHYRTIAWLLAFIAAGINLWHGLNAFDPATAGATAFASLAGPGVWDLHEHGRIRRRDGALSRRERKAQTKAAKAAAAEKAAAQQKSEVEKKAAAQAAEAAAQKLAADRERDYPDEWKYAVKLASAMGETSVTEKVWDRTFDVMHASKPGDTAADIRTRNIAVRRLEAARSEAPGNKPVKATSSQRASQMPATSKTRVYNPPARPGRRRKGDTPKYVAAARKQAAITARIPK